MEELEIVLECETNEEQEIELISEGIIIRPQLENLTITPSTEQQIFNHPNSYGYDEVVVEAVEDLPDDLTEELTEQDSLLTEQETTIDTIIEVLKDKAGIGIELQDKFVTPSGEIQEVVADENYDGLSKVTVDKINSEVLSVIPTSESQSFSGLYSEVNVAGDSDLLPENIKNGVEIFGVTGTSSGADFEINNCEYLFYNSRRIEVVNELLTLCKNVTNMANMFYSATELTEVDMSNFDTSNVTSMYNAFYYCNDLTALDVSKWDTSNVTDMRAVFENCSKLTALDVSNFDTSNVTSLGGMFSGCSRLTALDVSNWDTSNVTSLSNMFNGCSLLTALNLSNWDASKVSNCAYCLRAGASLTDLQFMHNLGKGFTQTTTNYSSYKLDLSRDSNLTHDSLMSVINNLYDLNLTYDVANGGTLYAQQLVLGSNNKNRLTADEIAIATNKGWVVS